jgi:hypothetical protein
MDDGVRQKAPRADENVPRLALTFLPASWPVQGFCSDRLQRVQKEKIEDTSTTDSGWDLSIKTPRELAELF